MHRGEYSRPQLVRDNCPNLNGQWGFEFDDNMASETVKMEGVLNEKN